MTELSNIAASDYDYTQAERTRLLAEQSDQVRANTQALKIKNKEAEDAYTTNKDVDEAISKFWRPTKQAPVKTTTPILQEPIATPSLVQAPSTLGQVAKAPVVQEPITPTLAGAITGKTPAVVMAPPTAAGVSQAPTAGSYNFPDVNPLNITRTPQETPPTSEPDLTSPNRPEDPTTPDHPIAKAGSTPGNENQADTSGVIDGVIAPVHETKEGSFDRESFLQHLINRGHGQEAEKWRKQFLLDDLTAEKQKVEMRATQNADLYGQLSALQSLPSGLRDKKYNELREGVIARGADPEGIPERYNQEYVDNLLVQSQSTSAQLKERHDKIEEKDKIITAESHHINAQANLARALKEASPDWVEVKTKEGVFMVNKKVPSQTPIKIGDLPPQANAAGELYGPNGPDASAIQAANPPAPVSEKQAINAEEPTGVSEKRAITAVEPEDIPKKPASVAIYKPTAVRTLAEKYKNGTAVIPQNISKRTTPKYIQDAVALAQYEDPSLDFANSQARSKMQQDVAGGKIGNQISAIRTAVQHMSSLSDNSQEVPHYGLQTLGKAVGNRAIAKATADQTQVADELVAVYRQTGGSEADIRHVRELLDPLVQETTRTSNQAEVVHLLLGKMKSIQEQYDDTMKGHGRALEILKPENKRIFNKILDRAGERAYYPEVGFPRGYTAKSEINGDVKPPLILPRAIFDKLSKEAQELHKKNNGEVE